MRAIEWCTFSSAEAKLIDWPVKRECFCVLCANNASVHRTLQFTPVHAWYTSRPRNSFQFSKTNTLILSTILNHQPKPEKKAKKRKQYRHTWTMNNWTHDPWTATFHLKSLSLYAFAPTSHDALSTGIDFSSWIDVLNPMWQHLQWILSIYLP